MEYYEPKSLNDIPIESRPGVYPIKPTAAYDEMDFYIPQYRMSNKDAQYIFPISGIVAFVIGILISISALFNINGKEPWYEKIKKASWFPSNTIWILIFVLIFSLLPFLGYQSIKYSATDYCRIFSIMLLYLNIILTIVWILFLFGYKEPIKSNIVLIIIAILVIFWLKLFNGKNKFITIFLIIYLLIVIYIIYLNFSIQNMNNDK